MKEELIRKVIEAEGQKAYWRTMYENNFIADYEEAQYRKWCAILRTLRELLDEYS